MNKTKTTQNETHKAAGNTPAAGASIGGNAPTGAAEKETRTAEVPETEDAAEAQATAEVASAKTEIVPVLTMCKDVVIVVCGTPEALPLLTKAWKQKAAPAVILPREVGSAPFAELITGLLAEEEIPDTFVLVPANCFPTHRVNLADLMAYRIRRKLTSPVSWVETSDTRLPVLLEATAVLKTLELLDNDDTFTAEEFFEKYNGIAHAGELPEAVGMSFGNTVAFADMQTPCMAKVAEALLRKKFICTTAEGFTPIKERLALLYGGK
jgi:hypothetical protein